MQTSPLCPSPAREANAAVHRWFRGVEIRSPASRYPSGDDLRIIFTLHQGVCPEAEVILLGRQILRSRSHGRMSTGTDYEFGMAQ
jgi:hypothetical protein